MQTVTMLRAAAWVLVAGYTMQQQAFASDTLPGPGAPALSGWLTNADSDAATGINWGRYAGFVAYADRLPTITGTGANTAVASGASDARTGNWHVLWGPVASSAPFVQLSTPVLPLSGVSTSTTAGGAHIIFAVTLSADLTAKAEYAPGPFVPLSAPILPLSGTVTYTAVGGTHPIDSLGNVGTWSTGTAMLSVNFTVMTVNTTVNATVGVNTWAASASNIPIINGTSFQAQRGSGQNNLTVTMNGSATGTAGNVTGVFFGNAGAGGTNGGADLRYSLTHRGATDTAMQGVTVFKK